MEDTRVVTGKPNYVKKRVAELKLRGYVVVNSHTHPHGDVTVKMERLSCQM
jgi:hypothetical protein